MSSVKLTGSVAIALLAMASTLHAQQVEEILARAPTGVTPQAEKLLAANAEPRRLQLRDGDTLIGLARFHCGRLTPTYFNLLLAANSGEKPSSGVVVIPACFATRIDQPVPVVPGETWAELAKRSAGVAGSKTLSGIFSSNIGSLSLPNGWANAVETIASEQIPSTVKQVQLPAETSPVAYSVRAGVDAGAFTSELRAALNVPNSLAAAPTAEPQLTLEAGVDPGVGGTAICPAGPPRSSMAWPFAIPEMAAALNRSLARLAQLGADTNRISVIAVIDNGIDGIFTPAFPEADFDISGSERANPNDNIDQDDSKYPDDVVGTNVYAGKQPTAFKVAAGSPGPALPAHGTMMSSLALGGSEYRTWLQSTPGARRVRIRPISIVRYTNEWSEQGNVERFAMPTEGLGKAIEYAAHRQVSILNLSVSTPSKLQSVEDALYNKANLLLVVAAGNSRVNLDQRLLYPAALSSFDASYRGRVVSVAAHDRAGCLSAFSGRGENSVDLAAPGVEIRSTVFNGVEAVDEGTSQATALVSFVAAQLRSIGVDSAPAIKERLIASVDLNAAMVGQVRAEGTLNAAKALDIYYDAIELAPTGSRLLGRLASPLTAGDICLGLMPDDRKVLKVSRRIDGGPAGEIRLFVRRDDRGRFAIVHCVPTSASIPFIKSDGQIINFRWADVWDLVPAV